MLLGSTFNEIAVLLALAAALGIAGLLLRQPLIVAFIVTGIIAGPNVFGIVQSTEHISVLVKVALFHGEGGFDSRQKYWLELDVAF